MSNPVNWRQTVERAEKREFVTGLNEVFKASGSVVVAHYAGLTVAQMNDLRSKMRVAGGTVKVAKNRLAKIALQGTESEGIVDLFKGQTLIAYSDDPIVAPKVAMDFAKTNDRTRCRRREGSCLSAVARRVARKARGYDSDPGIARRNGRGRTRKPACTGVRRLRQEGRSRIGGTSLY
jgi:hypothetical protein